MLAKGSVFVYPCADLNGATFQTMLLPHPGTGQPQVFLFDRTTHSLLELHIISRFDSSCFVADKQLVSHGNITAAVVFDFHFLLYPLLPREAFLSVADWRRNLIFPSDNSVNPSSIADSFALILELPVVETVIQNLCEVKEVNDERYMRFSVDKLVGYICRKFDNAVSDFSPTVSFVEGDVRAVLMDAIEGMIGEAEISTAVRAKLGISHTVETSGFLQAEAVVKKEPPKKKQKIEKGTAPVGCQKISAFFTKK